jgi:hypothetical protein
MFLALTNKIGRSRAIRFISYSMYQITGTLSSRIVQLQSLSSLIAKFHYYLTKPFNIKIENNAQVKSFVSSLATPF